MKNTTTLGELADLFLAALEDEDYSRSTISAYRSDLGLALRELGSGTKIRALTPKRIQAYNDSPAVTQTLDGEPKARAGVERIRRTLRLALEWGAEQSR